MSADKWSISEEILDGIFDEKDTINGQDKNERTIPKNYHTWGGQKKTDTQKSATFSRNTAETKTVKDQKTQTCFCHLWKSENNK